MISIEPGLLPKEEEELAFDASRILYQMEMLIADFRAAVALFETYYHCEDDPDYEIKSRWVFMAAQQGAMLIYSFGRARDALNAEINKGKTLRNLVASDLQKTGNRIFERQFPNRHDVRLSAAHPELGIAPESAAEHAVGGVFVKSALHNRHFSTTISQRWVGYEVSEYTARILDNVCTLWWYAFWSVNTLAGRMPAPPLYLFNEFGAHRHEVKITVDHD